MKNCPYCMGSIPDEAVKCMHCAEWVSPDARPKPQQTKPPESRPNETGPDGLRQLGEAAKTGVAAWIVLSAIGLFFGIIVMLVVFVPTWNRAEKRQDQIMNDFEKTRQRFDQERQKDNRSQHQKDLERFEEGRNRRP